MSIKIPQPSMALNAESVENWPTPVGAIGIFQTFNMWNTWKVAWDAPAEHIIDHVAVVAESAPDHYLRVVILNAHGSAASIAMGKKLRSVSPSFAKWRGRVANVWIIACEVAATAKRDGNLFCSALAKQTGAYVVASTEAQPSVVLQLPWGHVNDWDGLVLRYEPVHGSVDWHHEYVTGELTAAPPPIAVPPSWRPKPRSPWPSPHRGSRVRRALG